MENVPRLGPAGWCLQRSLNFYSTSTNNLGWGLVGTPAAAINRAMLQITSKQWFFPRETESGRGSVWGADDAHNPIFIANFVGGVLSVV